MKATLFAQTLAKLYKPAYLCNVFFIVLDLRLTRLGLSGAPFFMPNCKWVTRCQLTIYYASPRISAQISHSTETNSTAINR